MDLVNISQNYLNGFQQIERRENACELVSGILKVVSYALIIPALFCKAVLSINEYRERCRKLDMMEEIAIKANIPSPSERAELIPAFAQSMIVDRVAKSLKHIKKGEIHQKTFKFWFSRLDADGQKKIIKQMFNGGLVEEGIIHLPTDLKEFHIPDLTGGSFYKKAHVSRRVTYDYIRLIKFMRKLKGAEKITIDFRWLGMVCDNIINMTYKNRIVNDHDNGDRILSPATSISVAKYGGSRIDATAVVLTVAQVLPSMEKLKDVDIKYQLLSNDVHHLLYAHTSVRDICRNVNPNNVPKIKEVNFSISLRRADRDLHELRVETY